MTMFTILTHTVYKIRFFRTVMYSKHTSGLKDNCNTCDIDSGAS